jgi:hypothetical protein
MNFIWQAYIGPGKLPQVEMILHAYPNGSKLLAEVWTLQGVQKRNFGGQKKGKASEQTLRIQFCASC